MQVSPQPEAELVGGRFELLEPVGEGNFSVTHRGRDTNLGRTVAIKMLRPQYAADPNSVVRFEREARVAASVSHPNVVDVYDFGRHGDTFFIVMQFVPGHDLRQELDEKGRLPAIEAVRIVRQVLYGLGAIHAAGIVHRDIKPSNVLCARDGSARVTDFGIALGALNDALTSHGTTVGTASYMAPEQARGGAVSAATDLYAVGVVLFELLTKRLPFEADNPMAVMLAHLQAEPPVPSAVAPDAAVPAALDAVVLRALAKNPAERYASADEMALALDEAVGGVAMPTRQPPSLYPVPEPTTQLPAVEAPEGMDEPAKQGLASWSQRRDGARSEASVGARADAVPALPALPERRRRRDLGWLWPATLFGLALLAFGGIVAGGGLFGVGDGGGAGDDGGTRVVGALPGANGAGTPASGQGAEGIVASLPSATATATSTPNPTATATATPSPTATTTPPPTTTPEPTETPRPTPTRTPLPPTATSVPPTATPPPTATNVPPTATPEPPIEPLAGTSAQQVVQDDPAQTSAGEQRSSRAGGLPSLNFGTGSWFGGYRGPSDWYGGDWVALYGSESTYASATLQFRLDAQPTGVVQVSVTGLGDEYNTNFPIAFAVNGQLADESVIAPFYHWSPAAHGAQGEFAPWSTHTFNMNADAFVEGDNQLAIVSQQPGDGSVEDYAPYILLRGATITFD